MSTSMTFAQSYLLASKVRSKLTKEASSPKSSLRVLVTQANMLDNIMDHIAAESAKRKQIHNVILEDTDEEEVDEVEGFSQPSLSRRVSFDLSSSRESPSSTSVSEFEIEVESDSDSEFDSQSDSDSDYYYSSEEEDDEYTAQHNAQESLNEIQRSASQSIFSDLPTASLQYNHINSHLEVELDESEDSEADDDHSEIPELSHSLSLTDDEDFEHEHYRLEHSTAHHKPRYHEPFNEQLFKPGCTHHDIIQSQRVHHQRHNAEVSISIIWYYEVTTDWHALMIYDYLFQMTII